MTIQYFHSGDYYIAAVRVLLTFPLSPIPSRRSFRQYQQNQRPFCPLLLRSASSFWTVGSSLSRL